MKTKVIDIEGKQGKEIELPECFSESIREDIAQKYFETEKVIQPYAPYIYAGKQKSASGIVAHGRRLWKTAYGHGISRVPRKILWRRGKQFYWVGATIASAKGGRRAHPPRIVHFLNYKKVNRKEAEKAMASGISATASQEYVQKRYPDMKISLKFPIVVESKIIDAKAKNFISSLKKILGENYDSAIPVKRKNAGRGKMRGRKYRNSAGLLIVIGKNENMKFSRLDIKKTNELKIRDLFPLGRLAIYTESAIKDLGEMNK
ncbi:50S ribosomal protein L4 [Candidatus Pacearchaeota archaeon]|nr:50S ribosomal protein L4 [Candidatus Pacearchaeota archaeon]